MKSIFQSSKNLVWFLEKYFFLFLVEYTFSECVNKNEVKILKYY